MFLSDADWSALQLTFKLATVVTCILLVLCTPLAWWLATSNSRFKAPVAALVTLPLILPSSVIGFYLLMFMGPNGPAGKLTQTLGLGTLPFTFAGLVVASCIYSLPFVVQPIRNAFEAIGQRPFEVAATLGANKLDSFINIALPLAKPGFITAAILGFAHTIGEFGIILMIGGNIPGQTQVVSVLVYEHVEALEYAQANSLALVLLLFAFVVMLALAILQAKQKGGKGVL